jgi:hypothetical protein
MTIVWVAVFIGLPLLCLGALVGTSWTDQALCARYNRLAAERRELNEWRLALQEADRHRVWYGNQTAFTARDRSRVDDQVSAVTSGTPYLQEQFGQIAVW